MGAGIAVGLGERFPEMVAEYRRRCRVVPRELNPGDVFLWKDDSQPWVFNLATQEDYWRSRATYEAVERTLVAMRTLADAEGITSIAMPRVGAGYGGPLWKKLRPIVESVFADWSSVLYVYDDYVPAC